MAVLRGQNVLASTEAIGAAVLRRRSLRTTRLLAGAAVHLILSLLWARVLDRLLRGPLSNAASTRTERAVAGATFGLGIAALDLGIVGRRLPTIRSLATGPQVADHLAYGALVGWSLKGD